MCEASCLAKLREVSAPAQGWHNSSKQSREPKSEHCKIITMVILTDSTWFITPNSQSNWLQGWVDRGRMRWLVHNNNYSYT